MTGAELRGLLDQRPVVLPGAGLAVLVLAGATITREDGTVAPLRTPIMVLRPGRIGAS